MKALSPAPPPPPAPADGEPESISKSEMKRRMLALQEVGNVLVSLSPDALQRLTLPDELRTAVLEAKRISKHGGKNRQLQYIGRIMREIDAAPVIAQLQALRAPTARETALFHLAERWREELLAAKEPLPVIDRFCREYPVANAAELATLVEGTHRERRGAQPPRAFRQLFHHLNHAIHQHQASPGESASSA